MKKKDFPIFLRFRCAGAFIKDVIASVRGNLVLFVAASEPETAKWLFRSFNAWRHYFLLKTNITLCDGPPPSAGGGAKKHYLHKCEEI